MSEGEIMKMAMKQWRETPKEEKQVWEKKAREEMAQNGEEGKEEKKRKRKDENVEVNESLDSSAMIEEKENLTKKVKTSEVTQKANTKLAGFALSKKQ